MATASTDVVDVMDDLLRQCSIDLADLEVCDFDTLFGDELDIGDGIAPLQLDNSLADITCIAPLTDTVVCGTGTAAGLSQAAERVGAAPGRQGSRKGSKKKGPRKGTPPHSPEVFKEGGEYAIDPKTGRPLRHGPAVATARAAVDIPELHTMLNELKANPEKWAPVGPAVGVHGPPRAPVAPRAASTSGAVTSNGTYTSAQEAEDKLPRPKSAPQPPSARHPASNSGNMAPGGWGLLAAPWDMDSIAAASLQLQQQLPGGIGAPGDVDLTFELFNDMFDVEDLHGQTDELTDMDLPAPWVHCVVEEEYTGLKAAVPATPVPSHASGLQQACVSPITNSCSTTADPPQYGYSTPSLPGHTTVTPTPQNTPYTTAAATAAGSYVSPGCCSSSVTISPSVQIPGHLLCDSVSQSAACNAAAAARQSAFDGKALETHVSRSSAKRRTHSRGTSLEEMGFAIADARVGPGQGHGRGAGRAHALKAAKDGQKAGEQFGSIFGSVLKEALDLANSNKPTSILSSMQQLAQMSTQPASPGSPLKGVHRTPWTVTYQATPNITTAEATTRLVLGPFDSAAKAARAHDVAILKHFLDQPQQGGPLQGPSGPQGPCIAPAFGTQQPPVPISAAMVSSAAEPNTLLEPFCQMDATCQSGSNADFRAKALLLENTASSAKPASGEPGLEVSFLEGTTCTRGPEGFSGPLTTSHQGALQGIGNGTEALATEMQSPNGTSSATTQGPHQDPGTGPLQAIAPEGMSEPMYQQLQVPTAEGVPQDQQGPIHAVECVPVPPAIIPCGERVSACPVVADAFSGTEMAALPTDILAELNNAPDTYLQQLQQLSSLRFTEMVTEVNRQAVQRHQCTSRFRGVCKLADGQWQAKHERVDVSSGKASSHVIAQAKPSSG